MKQITIRKIPPFDYLVSMPVYSLTEEKIDELEKKILEKKQELDTLENTTANGLYQSELDELKLKELFAEKKNYEDTETETERI